MRGAAKHFNTLADVENSMAVDKEGTKPLLRRLKEGRFIWVDLGPLAAGASGLTDDTHKVMDVGGMDAGGAEQERATKPHQFALREDPNGWLFRLGLTVEKIDAYLEA